MTYYALALCLALSVFFLLNAVFTSAATMLWTALHRGARGWSASARAKTVFALRVLPPTLALAFVSALLVPAFLVYEPYPAPDSVGLPLVALSLVSAFGVGLALCRGVASWRATRRLTAEWLRRAEPLRIEGVCVEAYRLRHPTPVIAVVGAVRPRLFVAGQLFDALSREEMEVALAHERGHLVARDTLKRAVLKVCRDVLPIAWMGRALDKAWAEEAERAADEYAAREGAAGALNLAAALVKIARMMPTGASHVAPVSAFLLEVTDDGLAGRVRRLTDMAADGAEQTRRNFLASGNTLRIGLIGLAAMLLAMLPDLQLLATVHTLTEHVVHLLK
ncbi:MAG TPA: M48 family metalloprotease [Pyrinomonadaceae bacterium]|nr:M48 family metalloprotease [Pyrinomonadaceae bacterium]